MTAASDARTDSAGTLPLAGRRVLVTRAPHQASELVNGLRLLGATVLLIPTIEIGPPASFATLDAAIASLSDFDLVAFSSSNAVHSFAERAGIPPALPATTRIAAVGPATARTLQAIGLHADVVPAQFTAESLAESLLPQVRGRRVLLVQVEGAPTLLAEGLAAGGAHVQVAAAYANHIPEASQAQMAALLSGANRVPHAVTFTSASTARNLVALLQASRLKLPDAVARISIGPTTSKALDELGLPAHAEAAEATIDGLLNAVRVHLEHAR